MTPHYPARHEIHGHFADHALNAARHMPDWLDPNTVTVARLLRGAGFAGTIERSIFGEGFTLLATQR